MDLTNTFRSTNSGASLATNFGNFPYSNNIPTGRLTEDRFSAQNSRIGFRVDAKVRNANILGYMEGDFFGGVGGSGSNIAFNTQVTSNSIVYRMRLYWISVRQRRFEFLAGQSHEWVAELYGFLYRHPDLWEPGDVGEPAGPARTAPSSCSIPRT